MFRLVHSDVYIWYTIGMDFEYNIYKSKLNKQKHGISFDDAKMLWLVDNVVLPAVTRGNPVYVDR